MKKLKTILFAGVLAFTVSSCSFLEATPENVVSEEDNNKAKTTVYANFTGLFALIQDVADDLIFLTELRGDLLEPTANAPAVFQDIYTATATADNNELVNPAKFYKIVMNTNDFLRNAVEYNSKYPGVIPTATYRSMIGGAVCIRTWAYLTIAKLYGGAAYYDYSMTGEIDLSELPYLDFDRLINELVYFMKTGVDNVTGLARVDLTTMFDLEGDEWKMIAIQPDMLLLELYLWQKDYQNASRQGINLITGNGVASSDRNYVLEKSWSSSFNTTKPELDEAITVVFYDKNRGQTNNLNAYFGYSRDYYLAPTANFADLFRYDAIDKISSVSSVLNYYQRARGSMGVENGVYNVNKFGTGSATNDNAICLYRAGELHLMVAEALAHDKRFAAADSLINRGTGDIGTAGSYAAPFNTPIWAYDKTAKIAGVRGRGGDAYYGQRSADFLSPELKAVYNLPEAEQMEHELYDEYVDRRIYLLDSIIADETGRELGFEGKRWFTLLRVARNSDNPDFLAVPVSKKYSSLDQASMLFHFREKENWFLDDGIKK